MENEQVLRAAHARGKGVLLLTGHFGNFEVATAAGIMSFPEAHGRFHFVRRPFKPRWLENFVYGRSRRLGFGSLPKQGSLDLFIDRLEAGDLVLFPFDQYAAGATASRSNSSGIQPARSAASRSSHAPPAPRWYLQPTWRERDGHHVLRFEEL